MNPFRRAARAQTSLLTEEQTRLAWQAISLLLEYPGEDAGRRFEVIRGAVGSLPDAVRMPLTSFLDAVSARPLEEVQQDYVETFDHTRRCCLYLTYFSFGDTRRRGVALVQFKQAYRRAGADFDADELPDHLGVVLDFGATVDVGAAAALLTDHRAGVEMLRIALQERGSIWADLMVALCATLPELDGDGLAAVQKLIEAGPPREDVGLDGYAMDPRLNPRPESDRPATPLGRHIPVGAPS
ncbi:MAG TPA: nitrate reductase molybdenum cofactor assembly chaperone [Intrasporangium sp.]|uniref:nitrate reductase molybdenum cofactor assembly chaperone n=1 Tax=Intrasporangium sp. TaxID=1925024 RepID=UPI002D7A3ACA|nr:nitrate reductase molybdenum cofactor assembly chaperone [Intrasporangium sp.]HET7397660.1 nitrate reductase molybdenum cofactor assembly chaperone [Intrasporangium sp.]